MRVLVAALFLPLLAACSATAPRVPVADSPLLAMAESRHYLDVLGRQRHEASVLAAQAMLGAHAERDDCDIASCDDAQIETLRELGLAYTRLGLHRLSLAAYQFVLERRPDDATSHEDVAAEQMLLGRDADAARSYARAIELSHAQRAQTLGFAGTHAMLAGNLGRARALYESCVQLGISAESIQYCAIGLATVSMRGGHDSLLLATTPASAWPGPLLAHLRGELDETALAKGIAASDADTQRERLSEALYYVGEKHLARGDTAKALRFFRANQTQRVEAFFETEASARRIRELGGADDPTPEKAPARHIPIG